MPPANQTQLDQLNQQLDNLLTLSKEEVLDFFKADLDGLDSKKVVGNLKMLMMFMDAVSAEELKRQILNNLSEKSRKITSITQYLQTRFYDEMMAQIPVKEPTKAFKPKPSVHPQDYTQTSFPKNDHFDFEDAADIDQFHKIGTKYQWHSFDHELQKIMSILPSETQAELAKEMMIKRRLENIIITYLKDVRDELETRQRLSAPVQLGGMGFHYDLVNNIFQVLQKTKDMDKDQIMRAEAKEPQIKIEPRQPKLKVPQPPSGPARPGVAIPINQKPAIAQLKPQPIDAQRIVRISRAQSKNIISDIKHPPAKPTSPAEEFSALTLDDLRRDGEGFIKKILIKIDALAREDYVYRIQAIGAWKKSELYKQYMEIGHASLNHGQSVREYLSGSDSQNQLNYAEFETIVAINQKLRF